MPRARVLPAVIVGVLSAILWVSPAQAHNSLTGSNPRDGARVAEVPEAVTLTFLATLKPGGTTVSVTGPDGTAAADGTPTVKGNKVTVKLRSGVAGRYTVAYRVSSVDGHAVKGDITFTATKGAASGTGAPAPSGTSTPAGSGTSTPAGSGTSAPAGSGTSAPATSGTTTPAAGAPSGTPPSTGPGPGSRAALAAEDQTPARWPWLLGAALLAAAGAGAYLVRRRATR